MEDCMAKVTENRKTYINICVLFLSVEYDFGKPAKLFCDILQYQTNNVNKDEIYVKIKFFIYQKYINNNKRNISKAERYSYKFLFI